MKDFDPRTKLALGIMAIAAVLFAREPATLMVEFAMVLIAVALLGLGRKLLYSLRLIGSMIVFVFILGFIFFDFQVAGLLSIRLFTLLSVSFIFFYSLDPQEIGDALQNMGISFEFAFILTTSMRYVPMIGKKVRQISDAQQARGIDLRPRIKNITNFIALLMPLLVQSFILADDLALAMEARGFGSKQRKSRRIYHIRLIEYAMMALSLAILVAFVWWERG